MKKLTYFLAISFLGIAIASAPLVGLAHGNERGDSNYQAAKLRVEQKAELKAEKKALKAEMKAEAKADRSFSNNSIFSRLFGLFNGRAAAQTQTRATLTPTISGITSPTVLETGETGTWSVKASDPKNGSLSYSVDWGESTGMARFFSAEPAFVQTSTFTHAYAEPGTYTVKFTVKNSAGLSTSSSVNVKVVGEPVEEEEAPVISNLSVRATSANRAILRWTTDVPSDSKVWFDTESSVDTSEDADISRRGEVINHNITLNRLLPGTKYYVVVASSNDAGVTKSSEISFTTRANVNLNAPVITSLTGPTTVEAEEEISVTINAYDPKNGSLTYSADWGDNISAMALLPHTEEPFVQSATLSHIYAEPGTYTARFTAQNSAGLKATSSLVITVTEAEEDTAKPVISDVNVTVNSDSSATITWKTDEPSDSEVFYATAATVNVDSNSTASVSSDSMVTEHSIQITGLDANTKYYFVIESRDGVDNVGVSAESNFTTNS